jgi:hypothetical protein
LKKQINRNALILSIGLALLYFSFVFYYLLHSRQTLLQDYRSLSPCFYRQSLFVSTIFSDYTKHQGDILAIISIPIVLIFFGYILFRFSAKNLWNALRGHIYIRPAERIWMLALAFWCVGLAIYGHTINPICTDEVFSALNFADKPIGHLLSYYPIPNNHIFFDLINHFFGQVIGDYVVSGRVLSSLFYLLFILGAYRFLYKNIANHFVSFLLAALLAQQFIVWGVGSQARGYALSYWLQWISFVSFYNYFFSQNEDKKLHLFLIIGATILGFWTIPTFLYFFVFQCIVGLVICLYKKNFYWSFWQVIAVSLMGVYLVYLPVFCYSGTQLVFANKYIVANELSYWTIANDFLYYFSDTILPSMFGLSQVSKLAALLLFVSPILAVLLFSKKLKIKGLLLLFYVANWLSVLLIVLQMKHLVFLRAIGFQMHLSLLILFVILGRVAAHFYDRKAIRFIVLPLMFIFCSVGLFRYNNAVNTTNLYDQNTAKYFNELHQAASEIETDKNIWISDESFFWAYLLSPHHKIDLNNCAFNRQSILIISEDDKLNPPLDLTQYYLRKKISYFTIYERKEL